MKNRPLILLLSFTGLIVVFCIIMGYRLLYGFNIKTEGKKITLYIPEGSTYRQAMDSISAHFLIRHPKTFEWIAEKKKYPHLVKPGRFSIENDMS